MHLVIGTGQPRYLDFTVVSGRETIPAGWQVYAIFSGAYAAEQLNEDLFDAMTDEEYYTFRAHAREAREREAVNWPVEAETETFARSLLSKLRRRLLGGGTLNRPAGALEARHGMRSA